MLNHKGTQTIHTKNLVLREIREEDYIDMYRYTVKEEVARYVSWEPHRNIENTKTLCRMWSEEYKNGDRYNWAIVFDGKVIGNIDVVKIIDHQITVGVDTDNENALHIYKKYGFKTFEIATDEYGEYFKMILE